jgi:hypothetical protein
MLYPLSYEGGAGAKSGDNLLRAAPRALFDRRRERLEGFEPALGPAWVSGWLRGRGEVAVPVPGGC